MSRMTFVVAVLLVIGLASPASADEPVPTPAPSLAPPSQQQIDDAREALERLAKQGKQGASGAGSGTLTQAAGTADDPGSGAASTLSWLRISDEAWWTLGAGLLVLVVAGESTRSRTRRGKHRKGA